MTEMTSVAQDVQDLDKCDCDPCVEDLLHLGHS